MSKSFKGTINLDDRDSVPDWGPYVQPVAPPEAPSTLEMEAPAIMKRE